MSIKSGLSVKSKWNQKHRKEFVEGLCFNLQRKTERVIDGESEGGDCGEVMCAG